MPQTNAENLLAIGQEIAGCRVVQFLGAGGMGQVYKCEHLRLQRPVALKILPVLDSASIKRFLREARSAAKIEHPNVVAIYDVDQDPATRLYFIIMQLINGRNLAELVTANGKPIPWRQALKLIRGAAKGAGAVHALGLVHRDIKPANIMLSTTTRQAILMDFGLVREIERTEPLTIGSAGTPMFMSPEQCEGSDDLDGRSDIVSLGRTLYYLLTARLPYARSAQGKNGTLDIMNQIVSGRTPPPAHQLNPAVPPEVAQLVERAMAHRRERRFQNTAELVAAIDKLSGIADVPAMASQHLVPGDPGTETINNLPELELITDGSMGRPPVPRKWLVACSILAVCVVGLLAWILNRPGTSADAAKTSGMRIEISDPSIEVTVKGTGISIRKGDDKEIRVTPGVQTLIIRRGDFEFETDKLILKTGDKATIKVEVIQQNVLNYRVDIARDGAIVDSGVLRRIVDTSKMAYIPAGKVNLGNSEALLQKHANDVGLRGLDLSTFLTTALRRPETWVEVPAFYIDKYEVTNNDYAKFLEETKRAKPKDWAGGAPPVGFENDPVVWVSHADATAYAAWAKKKLPTEAQWLRAFRGDTMNLYPWGNNWEPARANVAENLNHPNTSAVTATPDDISPFGVFNMVGNVDEMLRELSTLNGRPCVVLRGANWRVNGAVYGNAAYPVLCGPQREIDNGTGFRCVYEEPAQSKQ